MDARQLSMQLRPVSRAAVARRLESDILMLLFGQKAFHDAVTFTDPGGEHASAMSRRGSAEACHREAFDAVTRLLSKLIGGPRRGKSRDGTDSTSARAAAAAKPAHADDADRRAIERAEGEGMNVPPA